MTLGGTVRMSVEGTRALGELERGADERAEASKDLGNVLRNSVLSFAGQETAAVGEDDDDEYEDYDEEDELREQAMKTSLTSRVKYLCCDSSDRNKCGCTNFCVKGMVIISALIALILIVTAFAAQNFAVTRWCWPLAIISIIVSCCGCNILCCACCQPPKDLE